MESSSVSMPASEASHSLSMCPTVVLKLLIPVLHCFLGCISAAIVLSRLMINDWETIVSRDSVPPRLSWLLKYSNYLFMLLLCSSMCAELNPLLVLLCHVCTL